MVEYHAAVGQRKEHLAHPMNQRTLGFIAVLLAVIGYSFLAIFIKWAYQDGLRPTDVLFFRFSIATMVIWSTFPAWHRWINYRDLTRKQFIEALQLGALFAIPALMAVLALDRITASTYTMIMYTYPATVALASLALGQNLSKLTWGAIVLAFTGSMLTIGSQIAVTSPLDIIFPLINMLSYAGYIVLSQYRAKGLPRLTLATITITTTFMVISPIVLLEGLTLPASMSGLLSVIGLSIVSTILPITAMLVSVALVGAATASVMAAFEPVMILTWAALFLGERISLMQFIGGALIICSVVLLNMPERMKKSIRQRLAKAFHGSIKPHPDRPT